MAIIVVLAAIAIPTFSRQLETAREANDAEIIRAAATDAFTKAYTDFARTNNVDTATGYSTAETTAFKQKTPTFEYMAPTIAIGEGSKSVTTLGSATTANSISFYFAANTANDGIKLADIKVGTTSIAS